MAEFTEHPLGWAEEHPYATAGIVVGAVLVIYFLFFRSSTSQGSADTAQTNLAAAYYAAEAQQATAGTQLNIAQDQMQAQVQTAAIQAGGAVAINQANATASQNIAASMYDASNVQSNDAMATAEYANQYAYLTAQANNQAQLSTVAMQTIIPQEVALTGGYAAISIPGMGSGAVNTQGIYNPNVLASQGYTPSQISQITGLK